MTHRSAYVISSGYEWSYHVFIIFLSVHKMKLKYLPSKRLNKLEICLHVANSKFGIYIYIYIYIYMWLWFPQPRKYSFPGHFQNFSKIKLPFSRTKYKRFKKVLNQEMCYFPDFINFSGFPYFPGRMGTLIYKDTLIREITVTLRMIISPHICRVYDCWLLTVIVLTCFCV